MLNFDLLQRRSEHQQMHMTVDELGARTLWFMSTIVAPLSTAVVTAASTSRPKYSIRSSFTTMRECFPCTDASYKPVKICAFSCVVFAILRIDVFSGESGEAALCQGYLVWVLLLCSLPPAVSR